MTQQMLDGESDGFSAVAAKVKGGPPIGKLRETINLRGDGKQAVTSADFCKALTVSWLVCTITYLIAR